MYLNIILLINKILCYPLSPWGTVGILAPNKQRCWGWHCVFVHPCFRNKKVCCSTKARLQKRCQIDLIPVLNNVVTQDHLKVIGTIDLQQLSKYSCSNDRMLLSCHGDIFDVSSRPDLYGWGPKSWQAGKDITWSVVTGKLLVEVHQFRVVQNDFVYIYIYSTCRSHFLAVEKHWKSIGKP